MVFLAFHQYLATNFHLNIFFLLEIVFLSYFLLEMMYHYILFKYFTSYSCFYLLRMVMLCKKEATIFHINGKKNLSHKSIWQKFRPSFTNFLRNLIMISICEKMRLQLLRKAKYSILASIFHIYLFFSYGASYLLAKYSVNLMVFLYITLNLETFFKNVTFWKNSVCH